MITGIIGILAADPRHTPVWLATLRIRSLAYLQPLFLEASRRLQWTRSSSSS